MPEVCEYCGRDDVTLYAWHGDLWCADDIRANNGGFLKLTGSLKEAPRGRPAHPTYEQPFVWQTPDGSVFNGKAQP